MLRPSCGGTNRVRTATAAWRCTGTRGRGVGESSEGVREGTSGVGESSRCTATARGAGDSSRGGATTLRTTVKAGADTILLGTPGGGIAPGMLGVKVPAAKTLALDEVAEVASNARADEGAATEAAGEMVTIC